MSLRTSPCWTVFQGCLATGGSSRQLARDRGTSWVRFSSTNCCRRSSTKGPAICTSPSGSRRCCGCTAACASSKPRCSTPEDTVALMKSITPERCQQELQEVGGTRLRLRLRHSGPVPRLGLQAEGQHRHGAAADSQQLPHHGAVGPAAGLQGTDHAAARAVSGDRPDRFRQERPAWPA